MALDGIMFEGVSVRVRRPTDYNPVAAAVLGPSEPANNLNVQAIGLQPGGSGMVDNFSSIVSIGLRLILSYTCVRGGGEFTWRQRHGRQLHQLFPLD
jgi:splicing factor U2AF subunit